MKIALLVCDIPAPNLVEKYGDYEQQFTQLFKDALKEHGSLESVQLTAFNCLAYEYPLNISDFDVLAISGSRASSYDNDEWIDKLKCYVRDVINTTEILIYAICFGHQVVAQAMGGVVEKNGKGWEIGWTELHVTPIGQTYFGGKETIRINQMHQDIVTRAPPDFLVLAMTDICPNHGMVFKDRVFTIQGHPEFVPEFTRELIEMRRGSVLSDELAEAAVTLSNRELDGTWLSSRIIQSYRNNLSKIIV